MLPSDAQSLSVVQAFEQAFPDWLQPASLNVASGMHESPETQSEFLLHCWLAPPDDVDELQAAGTKSSSNNGSTRRCARRGMR